MGESATVKINFGLIPESVKSRLKVYILSKVYEVYNSHA